MYSALDDKRKRVAAHELARVRDIERQPQVALLIDRWSEDWSQLAWLRLAGRARLIDTDGNPGQHARGVTLLRARYPQYAARPLEAWPLIAIDITSARSWRAVE